MCVFVIHCRLGTNLTFSRGAEVPSFKAGPSTALPSFISSLHVDGKKLEQRLKDMDSSDKRLKTTKKGLEILVGSGKKIDNLVEATEFLFQRDFPEFCRLDESSTKEQVFVPEFFLTKAFNNLNPGGEDLRQQEIDEFAKNDPKIIKHIKTAKRVATGDQPEMDLYNALKAFFATRKEVCAVFHGQNLYDIDITTPGGKSSQLHEKDFIIVNLTYRYVMIIEVKNTFAGKSVEKAEKQLTDAKELIQAWFGADLDETWSLIPIGYCNQVMENKAPSNAYLITGKFKSKCHSH